MLTIQEKNKVLDVLSDGLMIRRDINLPFFLDSIADTKKSVKNIEKKLNDLEFKINQILHILNR